MKIATPFLSMCRSSRAIILRFNRAKLSDRCFCYVTAAMFVFLRRIQTWRLQTKFCKFGWHTSANNARMKNSRELIFGKVVYISIIYRISDSWLFSLDENWHPNFNFQFFWILKIGNWKLKCIFVFQFCRKTVGTRVHTFTQHFSCCLALICTHSA